MLAAVARLCRIRFIEVSTPDRIGHLALEPDCYAKDRKLEGRWEISLIVLTKDQIANPCLLDHWRKHFTVVSNPRLAARLRRFSARYVSLQRYLGPYAIAVDDTAAAYATYRKWGDRAPLLALNDTERSVGHATLTRMGMPKGAWFVCVHSREGGYSPRDEHWHTYRNSDVADYIPSMEAIVARGGWCVRLGDSTMKPLPPMAGVIDYALSQEKSAAMDVFLAAECRFLLGNSSGLYILAAVFGRPCALANQTPLSGSYGLGPNDISIPKRLKRDGALLPLGPLFGTPAANYRFSELYEKDRLEMVNNTPSEILALTEEMLERLDGKAVYTADDEARQETFRAFFAQGHYSYGAASRIGRDFLRNLEDESLRSA